MPYKILSLLLLISFSVHCKFNSQGKVEQGTIRSMENGDVACYLDIFDERGNQYQEMADFEICDQTNLLNKNVKFYYRMNNVLAASCNGNPDCRRSDTVYLINRVEEIQLQSSNAPSHCFQNEFVIFSCNTRSNKVVSICSSQTLGPQTGYLQYRFGTIGSFPEYVYPSNHQQASKYFYSGNLTFSGGGGAYLKFINGTYNYTIYTGTGRGWDKQGVVINDRQHEISRYTCEGAWTSILGPQIFNQAGLTADQYGFEIPVDRSYSE